MPHLFGDDGREPTQRLSARVASSGVCVVAGVHAARDGSVEPRRRVAPGARRHEHERCGGPGVGVVGMCLTGGFALAMMADAPVVAPVLVPALPAAFSIGSAALRTSAARLAELAAVKAKVADGARCSGCASRVTPWSGPARFESLRRELGDGFVAVELDSSAGQPLRPPQGRALGAHRGPDRPRGLADDGCARPGARLPRRRARRRTRARRSCAQHRARLERDGPTRSAPRSSASAAIYDLNVLAYRDNPDVEVVALVDPSEERGCSAPVTSRARRLRLRRRARRERRRRRRRRGARADRPARRRCRRARCWRTAGTSTSRSPCASTSTRRTRMLQAAARRGRVPPRDGELPLLRAAAAT